MITNIFSVKMAERFPKNYEIGFFNILIFAMVRDFKKSNPNNFLDPFVVVFWKRAIDHSNTLGPDYYRCYYLDYLIHELLIADLFPTQLLIRNVDPFCLIF
jgi:hypothetical protein